MRRYETEKEIEVLIDNYVNKKWGLLKSGAQFKMSKSCVKRILISQGIKIRSNSECQRKYSLNEDYFDIENHNMAYILGFIAADGNIAKNSNEIKITLSIKDKEILEKIQKELNSSRPLREYIDKNGYEKITLDFCSEKIQNKLAEYGITPQKTLKIIPPYKLNENYIIDYIRGYFYRFFANDLSGAGFPSDRPKRPGNSGSACRLPTWWQIDGKTLISRG